MDYEKELPVHVPRVPVSRKRSSIVKWVLCLVAAVYLLSSQFTFTTTESDIDYKSVFLGALDINLAAKWSKIYTAEPHLAGTGYNLVNFTKNKFEEYGFEATTDEYEILVSYPHEHDLNLLVNGSVVYKAPLQEDVIDEDSTTSGDDLIPTFLGYAANGNVTAEYVYGNYGTLDDFARLKELGVDVTGKIVVVRYGGIFRGLKVKFAQENGAIGVLIYSDPGDDFGITEANGYKQYPEGPARQESSVQRGSVQFLGGIGAYPGDPTTPGYASKPGCERQDPHNAIGKIPVLPISIREVTPILKKLNGHGIKLTDKKWIGELQGFDYYTGPSKSVELNLYNDQFYNISTLINVYGEIKGQNDNEVILIGNHRDAWIKGGAGDPNSGSASMLEIARALGELKAQGFKFKRTIRLASWDGEEYGLLGSTEYGEYDSKQISKKIVAYLNVDVSVAGKVLNLQGNPSLFSVLKDAAGQVEYPGEKGGSLLDHYLSHNGDRIGTLGSGSDYTVFLEHLGVPSVDMGFSPGKDSAIYHYHSNYDSYHWMEKYGDPGFVYHNALSKFLGLAALELSEKQVLNLNLADTAGYVNAFFDIVKEKIPESWLSQQVENQDTWNEYLVTSKSDAQYANDMSNGVYPADSPLPFEELLKPKMCPRHKGSIMYHLEDHKNATLSFLLNLTTTDLQDFEGAAKAFDEKSAELQFKFDNRDDLPFWQKIKLHFLIVKQNKLLQYFERNFLHQDGLHQRDWFKHIIYASGRFTGYAGQVLPMLQEAIEDEDFDRFVTSLGVVSKTLRRINRQLVV